MGDLCCPAISETELVVQNPQGLHARPAVELVRAANAFQAQIRLQNLSRNGDLHNVKSLMDLLLAAVDCGHRVRLVAEGGDACEAIQTLAALINGAATRMES